MERQEVGMRNYARVASTTQCLGYIILFKLNKGVTFVWVLMFYELDIGNIDYKRKHAAYPSLLSGIPLT